MMVEILEARIAHTSKASDDDLSETSQDGEEDLIGISSDEREDLTALDVSSDDEGILTVELD